MSARLTEREGKKERYEKEDNLANQPATVEKISEDAYYSHGVIRTV